MLSNEASPRESLKCSCGLASSQPIVEHLPDGILLDVLTSRALEPRIASRMRQRSFRAGLEKGSRVSRYAYGVVMKSGIVAGVSFSFAKQTKPNLPVAQNAPGGVVQVCWLGLGAQLTGKVVGVSLRSTKKRGGSCCVSIIACCSRIATAAPSSIRSCRQNDSRRSRISSLLSSMRAAMWSNPISIKLASSRL